MDANRRQAWATSMFYDSKSAPQAKSQNYGECGVYICHILQVLAQNNRVGPVMAEAKSLRRGLLLQIIRMANGGGQVR